MSENKNTISDLLSRLVVDVDNMNAFLFSLEKILESKSENVSIKQRLSDGTETTINVPSFGYLKSKIENVSTNFDTLISANDEVLGIKSSNGDVRKFELKKVSKLVQDLENIKNTSLTVPTEFGVKNNWFFESFLNPLLFVGVDIASIITDDIDQFEVKRIIINSEDDDELAFFDGNYKEVNDLSLESVKIELDGQGIDYFEDDNTINLEVPINRFKGSFDVIKVFEEEVDTTLESSGETVSLVTRRYKVNTLNYTDVLEDSVNNRMLAAGDVLMTENDSEYRVVSVDKTNTEILLERIFGIDPITIGADILKLKPVKYRTPELQVNVGYNERQIIFIKPVSKSNNLTVDDYSNGFGVYTNELKITLEDESETTLESYYNNFVADFGLILLNAAKERKLPAAIAEDPNIPVLNAADFSVVQIDEHIKEDEDQKVIQNKIAAKESLKVRIKENTKKIDDLKSKLNDSQKTSSEKKRIEKKIKSSAEQKATLQSQLTSAVKEITLDISTRPAFIRTPKYRVRGFWPIPEAKENKYGKQEVVQFKVRYRYLSKKGTAPNAKQSRINQGGESKFAVFSPWTEVLTKARRKQLDDGTGLYVWVNEDLSNADEVNINQLDIPIRKGENVEIQIKSLSEAGWPDNSVESEYSDSIQVSFPEDIESAEEASIISQKTFAEEARLDFEDELTTRGLDLHLQNQFTTGERFFAHKSEDISSGFFTNEGNTIDLYEQLKSMKTIIEGLQQSITEAKGVIKVNVIDDKGNVSEVTSGDTLKLFAGFYRDEVADTSGGVTVYNDGAIVTKQYIISIENTSATNLQLVSSLMGGIEQIAPTSDPTNFPTSDYHVNRRYDLASLSVNSATEGATSGDFHLTGYQSSQVKSQYIYSRYFNYGLSEELYATTTLSPATSAYPYTGQNVGIETVPFVGQHYVPFVPSGPGAVYPNDGVANSDIWVGTSVVANTPDGGGVQSEFCIHIDHPAIQSFGAGYNITAGTNLKDLFEPIFNPVATQSYMPISHAVFMETSVNEDIGILGNKYYVQSARNTLIAFAGNGIRTPDNYPTKIGFKPDDEFLIGKYTCGNYLFVFPNDYPDISVDGNHPSLSIKEVAIGSENSINIPVLYQFRASDKLGNIGGYRDGVAPLNNIKYTKKIGIDIGVKDEAPFSFDIEISSQYKKETTLDAPIVPSRGNVSINF